MAIKVTLVRLSSLTVYLSIEKHPYVLILCRCLEERYKFVWQGRLCGYLRVNCQNRGYQRAVTVTALTWTRRHNFHECYEEFYIFFIVCRGYLCPLFSNNHTFSPPPRSFKKIFNPPLPNIILPNPECSYANCFG